MKASIARLFARLSRARREGIPLRIRLFGFITFLLLAVTAGSLLIMVSVGAFRSGEKKAAALLENELSHLSDNVGRDFGKLSVQGIDLAESLAAEIDAELSEQGITASELSGNAELIEKLLSGNVRELIATLKNAKSSGAFIVLDATVNPALPNAEHSKAGIFLKCAEPNIVNSTKINIRCLRGPISLARDNGIELLPQWKLEFTTENDDFFNKTITAAKESDRPVSRLYYWSDRVRLDGNSESALLLCVPLICGDGSVVGICGFEVSSMLCKLSYSPVCAEMPRAFSTLAPIYDSISLRRGIISGNYYHTNEIIGESIEISEDGEYLNRYREQERCYYGVHREISLYPSGSAHENEKWLLAVMLPEADLKELSQGADLQLTVLFLLLLTLSILAAFIISRKSLKPVLSAFDDIKNDKLGSPRRTKIPEIDDLFEFLATEDAKRERAAPEEAEISSEAHKTAVFERFVESINTLSPAERAVFNLYVDGKTAAEIADLLFVSINTIKTHNKKIYMKLNVSSRKELLVYTKMMKELGQ